MKTVQRGRCQIDGGRRPGAGDREERTDEFSFSFCTSEGSNRTRLTSTGAGGRTCHKALDLVERLNLAPSRSQQRKDNDSKKIRGNLGKGADQVEELGAPPAPEVTTDQWTFAVRSSVPTPPPGDQSLDEQLMHLNRFSACGSIRV